MINLFMKAIMRKKLKRQLERELKLADLCYKAGAKVANTYGQRGTGYDVLAEVEQLCKDIDSCSNCPWKHPETCRNCKGG